MREAVAADLDEVDELDPGEGALNLGLMATGTAAGSRVGAFADYAHRLNEDLSAFARGEFGYDSGLESAYWSAIGGLRLRF